MKSNLVLNLHHLYQRAQISNEIWSYLLLSVPSLSFLYIGNLVSLHPFNIPPLKETNPRNHITPTMCALTRWKQFSQHSTGRHKLWKLHHASSSFEITRLTCLPQFLLPWSHKLSNEDLFPWLGLEFCWVCEAMLQNNGSKIHMPRSLKMLSFQFICLCCKFWFLDFRI